MFARGLGEIPPHASEGNSRKLLSEGLVFSVLIASL
jgi:hypothetical protein